MPDTSETILQKEIASLESYIAHVERKVSQATDERTRAIRLAVLLLAQAALKKLRP